jgi:hypothetical protein
MIFGYLDAGSGSLILQAVIGGLTGIGVAVKAWRSRLRGPKTVPISDEETAEAMPDPAVQTES